MPQSKMFWKSAGVILQVSFIHIPELTFCVCVSINVTCYMWVMFTININFLQFIIINMDYISQQRVSKTFNHRVCARFLYSTNQIFDCILTSLLFNLARNNKH